MLSLFKTFRGQVRVLLNTWYTRFELRKAQSSIQAGVLIAMISTLRGSRDVQILRNPLVSKHIDFITELIELCESSEKS